MTMRRGTEPKRAAAEAVRTGLEGLWGLADLQRRSQGCGEPEAGG